MGGLLSCNAVNVEKNFSHSLLGLWSQGSSPAELGLERSPSDRQVAFSQQPTWTLHRPSLWQHAFRSVILTAYGFTHNFLCFHLQIQEKQMTKKR